MAKSDASYNRLRRVLDKLNGVFNHTIAFQITSTDHNTLMSQRIWETEDYKKLTREQKGVVEGARMVMWDRLYSAFHGQKPFLLFIHKGRDGRLFGPGDDSWLLEDHDYKSNLDSTHAWAKSWNESQTVRPW